MVTLVGSERLDELYPVWASFHEHHAELEKRSATRGMGRLRSVDSSWRLQRQLYERALSVPSSFLVLAERDDLVVGYLLVTCRSHPVWQQSPVGSVDVLAVRASHDRGMGSTARRGTIVKGLLARALQEFDNRGLQLWSVACLSGNSDIRRLIDRFGGEIVQVTYQGRVADVPRGILGGSDGR